MEYYNNNETKNEHIVVKQEKVNTKKVIYLGGLPSEIKIRKMNSDPEEIKVILVGEAATRKTSLINTSVGIPFKEEMITSSTNSFTLKEFIIGEKKYVLNLWDTMGQDKISSLIIIY